MANTVGFQMFSLRAYEDGYEAAYDILKGLGISTIEPWCGAVPNDPDTTAPMGPMREALNEAGMKLTCGHITAAEYDERYEPWRDLLLEFGSRDWVIPFAKAESLDEWLALLPKFREMAARMKGDGLSLAYHNHHFELVKLGEKYVMEHLLDNMPELKAQFHIAQFKPERGIVLVDWIRKYQGRVCSLHINDSGPDGSARLCQGTCRAEEAIQAALDTGIDTYIIEVPFTRETVDGVKQDIETLMKLVG